MDVDDRTIGRIFTRREAIGAVTRAGITLAVAGWLQRSAWADVAPTTMPAVHLVATPALTEGPFFVDEKLNRSDLVGGYQRVSVANGVPLALSFTLYKLASDRRSALPMAEAQIDLWHCDAAGVYSDESNPMNPEDTARQTWLRGYQRTDAAGTAQFNTIIPGWYPGRTPHLHFKVRQLVAGKATAEFTSQLFLPDDFAEHIYQNAPYLPRGERGMRNADDGIYSEPQADGKAAGAALTLNLTKGATATGYAAPFAILLTEASLHSARRDRGPGPGPGGPGGDWWDGPPPF